MGRFDQGSFTLDEHLEIFPDIFSFKFAHNEYSNVTSYTERRCECIYAE